MGEGDGEGNAQRWLLETAVARGPRFDATHGPGVCRALPCFSQEISLFESRQNTRREFAQRRSFRSTYCYGTGRVPVFGSCLFMRITYC